MSVKNNKKYNLSLTKRQVNQVIEALLFAGSINIGADWHDKDYEDLVDLAVCIKASLPKSALSLENLTLYVQEGFEDDTLKCVEDNFDIECFSVRGMASA